MLRSQVVLAALAAVTVVCATTTPSSAQQARSAATFIGAFERAEIAATQCMDWNAFRARLTGT